LDAFIKVCPIRIEMLCAGSFPPIGLPIFLSVATLL
jgi:hypothetical protein